MSSGSLDFRILLGRTNVLFVIIRADGAGVNVVIRAVKVGIKVVAAVREAWPQERPLFVRLSATDWIDGGWDVGQSVELTRRMKP